MIMPIGTALSCRCSDGARASGRVVESGEGEIRVRFDAAGDFEPGACVEVRYTPEGDARVWVVGACVESTDACGVTTVALSGEAAPENQRSAYRVVTACADLKADVGRQRGCRVLDVSESGLATELVNPPRPGTVFEVKLDAFGQTVRGRFVLRYARPDRRCPQGEIARCGLQVDQGQPELAGLMRRVVMEAQRAQLRNRSRLTGRSSLVRPVAPAGPVDPAQADAPAQPSDAGAERAGAGIAHLRLVLHKVAGKPMPFSLQDADGRIVVARGETVDDRVIEQITSGQLEICEDWFGPAPDATGAERRVCERRSCQADVRVWLVGPEGAKPVDAEMVDLSRGGAGVRTRQPVEAGSLVVVEFTGRPGGGWIVARVQSAVVAPGSTVCRMGLRFLQSGVRQTPTPSPAEMVRIAESFEPRRRRAQSA